MIKNIVGHSRRLLAVVPPDFLSQLATGKNCKPHSVVINYFTEKVTKHWLKLSSKERVYLLVFQFSFQNPFLYLKGIHKKDLLMTLAFMYNGQVNVAQVINIFFFFLFLWCYWDSWTYTNVGPFCKLLWRRVSSPVRLWASTTINLLVVSLVFLKLNSQPIYQRALQIQYFRDIPVNFPHIQ